MELDDVHGGHGEAGAVDEACDVAVEADVVQAELAGGDFARVFLRGVTHGDDVLLAVEGVVVEIELGVEGDDLAVGGDGERIDLHEGAVGFDVEIPEGGEKLHGLVHLRAAQIEGGGDLAALVGLQAEGRVDELLGDLFRRLFRDFLDVHAAFRAGDDGVAAGATVEEDGKVVFLRDVHGFGDEHLAHQFAFRAGLVGDEGLAEHLAGDLFRLFRGVHDMDAAFEAVFEGAFSTTTGMDLGFDHEAGSADLTRCGACFLRRAGDDALGAGDAEFFKQLLGLVLVDVHGKWGEGSRDSRGAVRSVKAHSRGACRMPRLPSGKGCGIAPACRSMW